VLGIGGLKEKTVAALRNRISHVILPQENARDLDELPAEVKAGIHFHPVRSMDEVLAVALARKVIARVSDETPTMVAH
jgi:ATP-dependent Lon protease